MGGVFVPCPMCSVPIELVFLVDEDRDREPGKLFLTIEFDHHCKSPADLPTAA